ncbi:MAG: arginase family protein [Rhodospirillales bacterium]|nr:arginase family protein [Rhodospirillales bacterium]
MAMTEPKDPYWPKASEWLRGDLTENATDEETLFAVLGAPISQASVAPNGCHLTPSSVRQALSRFSPFAAGVGWPEPRNFDLSTIAPVDLGDVETIDLDNLGAQKKLKQAIESWPQDSRLPRLPDLTVFIGGDDCVMLPIMTGYPVDLDKMGLLTLDAHHDVRAYYRNQGPHNGSPVRGLIDEGLPGKNVIEIGMSSFGNSVTYRGYCEEQGITVIGANAARAEGVGACVERNLQILAEYCDIIFVDFDHDVIELGFGPACGGARPGGLAPWEVHQAAFAAGANAKVRGLFIVEIDPAIDPQGTGADNGALSLLHAAAGLLAR